MAASRCSFRRNFVRVSIKICRRSSTLTGTASKYIGYYTSMRDNKIEIPFKLDLVLPGIAHLYAGSITKLHISRSSRIFPLQLPG